jgi:ribonuclease HI
MNKLVVACDGSCLKNPGGAIGWSWADNKGRWQANGLPTGTNQVAELIGLLSVLYAFPNTDLHIKIDSRYAMDISTKWMFTWKKNGWWRDTQQTKAVSNLTHVKALYEALRIRKKKNLVTTFEWVKGHASDTLNNKADKEAQAAARRVKAGKPAYADSAKNTTSERQTRMLETL